MRFNRFTFHNDTMAFSELGSEEEAAKAVDQLNNTELQGKKIVVKKMQPDFQWERTEMSKGPFGSRYFYDEADNAEKALRPLAEGRRYMLRVQTPGWTVDVVSSQVKNAVRIIQENFEGYGIENIGDIHPFYGDLKTEPRLLCYMDFKTKEGADEAVQKHHDTEIGGRRTWLTPCTPNSYRTHHMAKVAPKLVAEMQEQGILPKETREDLFVNPLPEKESK
jgi:RNA recognition motif-containing protein